MSENRKRNVLQWIGGAMEGLVFLAGAVILIPLAVFNSFFFSHIGMRGGEEHPELHRNPVWFFLLLAAGILALRLLGRAVRKISERKLFLICAAIYIAAALFLIWNSTDSIRDDAVLVYEHAQNFNNGAYWSLEPGKYLNHNPHQLGLLTYERALIRIWNNPRMFFLCNLLWVLLMCFVQWKITKRIFRSTEINKYVIVLSFLFLPSLFFILFAYGQIPGLCATEIGLYFFIRHWKEEKPQYLCLGVLFFGIACLLKINYAIAVIVIDIIYVIRALKYPKRMWGSLAAGVLAAAAAVAMLYGTNVYYERVSGQEISGEPVISYVAEGLQDTGENLGGWYNGFAYDLWNDVLDEDKARQASWEAIRERAGVLVSDPSYAMKFFYDKIWSTWCDPLFQSVWSGPSAGYGQETYHILLQSLYRGGYVYIVIEKLMNVLNVLIYGLAGLYIVRDCLIKRAWREETLFFVLYFLGGFFYHLISQTKSQYVYMYMFLLIPLAACAAARLRKAF